MQNHNTKIKIPNHLINTKEGDTLIKLIIYEDFNLYEAINNNYETNIKYKYDNEIFIGNNRNNSKIIDIFDNPVKKENNTLYRNHLYTGDIQIPIIGMIIVERLVGETYFNKITKLYHVFGIDELSPNKQELYKNIKKTYKDNLIEINTYIRKKNESCN